MNRKFCILVLLLLTLFSASYSQRTIREYWIGYAHRIRVEYQTNSMGVLNGFYRLYYEMGGYCKTGFYTNGKETGLWSNYNKGATKPYYQKRLVLKDGQVYSTMEKEFFSYGSNAGKLKEWTEWDITRYAHDYNPQLSGLLVVRWVLYSGDEGKYFMLRDFKFGEYYKYYDDEKGVVTTHDYREFIDKQ